MFQEAPHDAAHVDAVAHSQFAGPQSAHAANDQVDINSGLRCPVQFFDNALVQQPIHLCDDARWTALPRMVSLTRNQCQRLLSKIEWGHQQRLVVRMLRIRSQKIKKIVGSARHALIRGQ